MKSTIQIEGILGSPEEETIFSSQEKPEKTGTQIVNVQVRTSYPQTGEQQSYFLLFSGICLLILLMILKKRQTAD